MASTPKQVNGNGTINGALGKRKKSRENRGSYLNKWLDKTVSHRVQDPTPSMETFESYNINPGTNWPMNNIHYPPNFDPCRYNVYGCTPEPTSLPTIPTYYNPSMLSPCYPDYRYVQSASKGIQVQRPRLRRRSDNKADEVTSPMNGTLNTTYLQSKNFTDSQDFASLPPIVTSVGDTMSNSDLNGNEKDDDNGRSFSDPCVRRLPDVAQPTQGGVQTESECSSQMSGSHVGSKLLSCLLDQITSLKSANERLQKDLQETKAELQSLRQQNAIWQNGSPTSLGGAANHSPLGNNGLLGTAAYTPGLLTDVVREIRDAARLREEALCARVRAMIIERNDANGLGTLDSKFSERSLDEIKSSLRASDVDKRRMLDRIAKLEDELKLLRVANGLESNDGSPGNGTMEESDAERMRLRKELVDTRRAKQQAEENALKLERLVTQLRSKFGGPPAPAPAPASSGPESLPSEPERARRASVNSTVVFGPVTDL